MEIAGKAIEIAGMIHRKLQRVAIAAGEQFRLARSAAAPHRPDRVDHIAMRQVGRPVIAPRRLGNRPAHGIPPEDPRPAARVDRAIDAASTQQRQRSRR